MKRLILVIIFMNLVACSMSTPTVQSPSAYPDLFISMERDSCYGTCPDYTLTIRADGTVAYTGRFYVKITGYQSTKIDSNQIQELVAAIKKANFFKLHDEYSIAATDLPSVTLSITLNGENKRIRHYGALNCRGEFDSAPKELCELENKIDEIVKTKQWVK